MINQNFNLINIKSFSKTITLVQSPKISPFTFLVVDCVEPDLDPG